LNVHANKPDKEEKALMKRAEKAADARIKDGTLKLVDKVGYIKGYTRKQAGY
jgi:hypothetical protein